MNRLRRFFALPLLVKELTESAARPRTYVARVLFAVGLYGIVWLFLPKQDLSAVAGLNVMSMLGTGRNIYEAFVMIETVGIALFLPAMMCGCITQEKERDSLVLLLLTELKPWQILLQKYLGGIVPVLGIVLLGAPLLAAAYSLGGVAIEKVAAQSAALLLHVLLLGSLTLLCSVWCRSTVNALLTTYFLAVAMFFGPPFMAYLLVHAGIRLDDEWFTFLFAPSVLVEVRGQRGSHPLYESYLPAALLTLALLILARIFFLRRAFLPPSNFLTLLFRSIDALMQRANRLTGGVMVLAAGGNLPEAHPIFWRETKRRGLGRLHHLLRIFVVLETIAVALCLAMLTEFRGGFIVIINLTGALVLLTIGVQAANVVISERVDQTLEPLLTTQLSGAQIIREKERALLRLMVVLAMPLFTIAATYAYLRGDWDTQEIHGMATYLGCWAAMLCIFLPFVTLLGMLVGTRMRTRFRAIVVTIAVLVTWWVLPLILAEEVSRSANQLFVKVMSPAGMISSLDYPRRWMKDVTSEKLMIAVFASLTIHAGLAVAMRFTLRLHADRWLRR